MRAEIEVERIRIADIEAGLKMANRGFYPHPHTDNIKARHVANGVRMKLSRSKPGLTTMGRNLRPVVRGRNEDIVTGSGRPEKGLENGDMSRDCSRRIVSIIDSFFLDLLEEEEPKG